MYLISNRDRQLISSFLEEIIEFRKEDISTRGANRRRLARLLLKKLERAKRIEKRTNK